MTETPHRAGDPEPVRITREIPLPWLVGVVVGLIVQAVTLYIGQQAQAEAIRMLSSEIKELRAAVQAGAVKDIEYGLRIDGHERRITAIEGLAAQFRAAERAADAAGAAGKKR